MILIQNNKREYLKKIWKSNPTFTLRKGDAICFKKRYIAERYLKKYENVLKDFDLKIIDTYTDQKIVYLDKNSRELKSGDEVVVDGYFFTTIKENDNVMCILKPNKSWYLIFQEPHQNKSDNYYLNNNEVIFNKIELIID